MPCRYLTDDGSCAWFGYTECLEPDCEEYDDLDQLLDGRLEDDEDLAANWDHELC